MWNCFQLGQVFVRFESRKWFYGIEKVILRLSTSFTLQIVSNSHKNNDRNAVSLLLPTFLNNWFPFMSFCVIAEQTLVFPRQKIEIMVGSRWTRKRNLLMFLKLNFYVSAGVAGRKWRWDKLQYCNHCLSWKFVFNFLSTFLLSIKLCLHFEILDELKLN